ncbi:MAG TPA: hypothetical protein PLE68_10195 [Bacillota bacterium]|nr:hypothetical protein [Bacillota bacterium]
MEGEILAGLQKSLSGNVGLTAFTVGKAGFDLRTGLLQLDFSFAGWVKKLGLTITGTGCVFLFVPCLRPVAGQLTCGKQGRGVVLW